jgi:inner membrane protein
MDLLTQGIVGAAAGAATRIAGHRSRSTSDREPVRVAALAGALGALLADADVLLGSPGDPLIAQELHRHFTHSLLFVLPGGLLLALLLRWPLRRRIRGWPLVVACCAGLLTAGLLDACTGYGTHLGWPLSDTRVALNLVSIVDPLFTLLVAVPLLIALIRARPEPALLALGLGLGFLLLAFAQQQRGLETSRSLAAERGLTPERILVRPSFGNILLWRSLTLAEGHWYADAIRLGTGVRIYEGSRVPAPELPGSGPTAEPVHRLARLSEGVLVRVPGTDRWGDLRFAMLPDSTRPMWGLIAPPDREPVWFTDRELTPAMRDRFLDMLAGRPVVPGKQPAE